MKAKASQDRADPQVIRAPLRDRAPLGPLHSRPRRSAREACLAQRRGETYGCFKIQDPDTQAACLGGIKNDKSYCFKIQGADQRNACVAREKGDRGYCFKIQSDDLQKDCLANTPR